jgi:hypothetical protein
MEEREPNAMKHELTGTSSWTCLNWGFPSTIQGQMSSSLSCGEPRVSLILEQTRPLISTDSERDPHPPHN